MKINFVLFILILFFLILFNSCIRDNNPLSTEQKIIPRGGCETAGIYIDFVDTCSYDFVISFLSEYDSVKILETYLGVDLFLYADSGDTNYWFDYFKSDTLRFSLNSSSHSDSLILIFRFINEEFYFADKDNLISHRNLHFKNEIFHDKVVRIEVPENSERTWVNFFDQFDFIEYVDWLIVCYE